MSEATTTADSAFSELEEARHRRNERRSRRRSAVTPIDDRGGARRMRGSAQLRLALVALDAGSVAAGWLVAGILVNPSIPYRTGHDLRALAFMAAVVPAALLVNRASRLYRASACAVRVLEIGSLARASAMTAVIMLAGAQVLDLDVAETWVTLSAFISFGFLNLARALYRFRLTQLRKEGRRHVREVVIVGANDEAFGLWRLLDDHPEVGFRVCGVLGDREQHEGHPEWAPWLGDLDQVAERVLDAGATGVFIAPTALSSRQLNVLCRELLTSRIHVQVASALRGIDQRRVTPHPVAREAMFYVQAASLTQRQEVVKRAFDLLLASVAIVAVMPVMLLASLAILVLEGRPILFRQRRIGRNGIPFTIYKFRSMVPDAETRLVNLMDGNERQGPLFKLSDDPRVTRIGRFLRETSIDELPQLLNVLNGTMSLVGPRPALPSEIEKFDEELLVRHRVKPGITGLWQVHSRDKASFDSYHRLDLFYVENWSLTMDFAVLALTVPTVASRACERLVSSRRRKKAAAAGDPMPASLVPDGAPNVVPITSMTSVQPTQALK